MGKEIPSISISKKNSAVETSTRPPLISADKNNDNNNGATRSRTIDASSRARVRSNSPSPISRPRRSPSPSPTTSRALSAERKRPSSPSPASPKSTPLRETPRKFAGTGALYPAASTPVKDTSVDTISAPIKITGAGAAAPAPAMTTPFRDTCVDAKGGPGKITGARLPDAVWPSTVRSLNVSFQSDKSTLPNKKHVVRLLNVSQMLVEKTMPVSGNPTPESKRAGDQLENSKLVDGLHARVLDQMRWPSSTTAKVSSNSLTKSMDNAIDKADKASNALHIGMGVSSLKRMSFPDIGSKVLTNPERDSVSLGSFDGNEGEESEQRSVDNISLEISNIGYSSLSTDSPDKISFSPSSVSSESPSQLVASNPASRGFSPFQTRALDPAFSRGVTKRVVIDQLKNSKPIEGLHPRLLDQCRWPSSTVLKVSSNALTKSADAINETARASRRMSFPDFGSIHLRKPKSDSVTLGSFNGSEGQEFDGSSIDYDSMRIPSIGASTSCPTSPNKTSSPSSISSVSPSRAWASHLDQFENFKQVEGLHARGSDQHRWPGGTEAKVSTNTSPQSMDGIEKITRVSNELHLGMGVCSQRRMSFPDFRSKPLEKSKDDSTSVASFDASEIEDFVGCSVDDISLRTPKIGSSNSCSNSPDKTSLSPSSVYSLSPSRTKAYNASFRGVNPSLIRTSIATAPRGVRKSGVTDKLDNSKPTEGLHSRPSEPRRWPSSMVVKVSSSSTTKSMDGIDSVDKASNILHVGIGLRRMSFPDFGSKPVEKTASDSASLVSCDGSEREEFEVCSFDDNSLRIPNLVSLSSCPVSPDKASQSPSSVSSVSPSRSRSTHNLSIKEIGPSQTSASNSASLRGISPSRTRASNRASGRGVSPTPTRASNVASARRGVSPTPVRALSASSTRGLSPTPTRVSNVASTRGISPTPTRAMRGVSPTPTRVSNASSTRGVSPTPTRATRGISPTPTRATRGISPTPTRATRGISPTPTRAIRGISPTPTRATRGISPTPTTVSNAPFIRGVSPTPTRATNVVPTRGVSPTPIRASNVASTRGVSPTPTRATRGVSPTPTRATRGVSPTPTKVLNSASTRGVSPTPTRATNGVPRRGASPTPTRASNVASTRGVSPTPSTASNASSPGGVSLNPTALKLISTSGASPSPMWTSNPPTRGVSPTLLRPSSPSRESSSSTSVLSFTTDIRKGSKDASQIKDVHQLRLLDTIYLQWRYVNARADKLLYKQKVAAERKLYNVWRNASELSDSITEKRIELEELRLKLKLYSVLHKQMKYLEEWTLVERDHTSVLSQAIEDIKENTLNLPVTGGARADTESVKAAVCSAIDVMQRIGSSICSILSRVEGVHSLVYELAGVAAEERALLDECEALLSTTLDMLVEEYSLRTHLVQLKRAWKGDEQPTSGH
ncbi:hypothetical protein LguiA_013486 [Lonicera macranthoides]